jgi:hypothetical protein
MLIVWLHSNKDKNNGQDNNECSFQKHDNEMKKFRASHPEIEIATPGDIVMPDGQVLASAKSLRLNKYVHN